ncbi:MAG: GTPase family protein [Synechococcales bacterium]|nr:GTPase family protein [Synechococcales bacterium]
MQLQIWQWIVLVSPIAFVVSFLLIAAGWQIHAWGLNWIWAVFTLALLGWRWLLVRWTRSVINPVEAIAAEVSKDLTSIADTPVTAIDGEIQQKTEAELRRILDASRDDPPIWEDWAIFWQRCRDLVGAIAHLYHPDVKYPLLNIYVPQAYGLIRGTVDDVDRWMQQLSPALGQVTVGQAYQGYEMYRKLEPSARKLLKIWNWAQWVVNPAVALARQASRESSNRATQELLVNLSQMLREAALRNLARQAIALYSGSMVDLETSPAAPALPKAKTQTLRTLLEEAEPVEPVKQAPVSILLTGRTGAGKSSLINTLFQAERAEVDVLPSTDQIRDYHWQTTTGEGLDLWDTPGYEQVKRSDLRDLVLDYATNADLLLLVTPALDPALQMDVDFLKEVKQAMPDLPTLAVVTQVDRLRPIREWQPPYDWQWGDRPKERAIREATEYRTELLGEWCDRLLPIVTGDAQANRESWNVDALAIALVEAIDPAKQARLARFLRDRDARVVAAARIIDQYTFQMATTQGLTALLKSPVLQFISTLTTGSPALAYVLAEQIPVEQLPVVIGKLQLAYDLFNLLNEGRGRDRTFDLLALWPLLLENPASPDRTAWAFGHALVEYWTRDLSIQQVRERFMGYLEKG